MKCTMSATWGVHTKLCERERGGRERGGEGREREGAGRRAGDRDRARARERELYVIRVCKLVILEMRWPHKCAFTARIRAVQLPVTIVSTGLMTPQVANAGEDTVTSLYITHVHHLTCGYNTMCRICTSSHLCTGHNIQYIYNAIVHYLTYTLYSICTNSHTCTEYNTQHMYII